MRRLFVLALLLGGMQLIFPLGTQGQGGHALLVFGFLVLAAYTVGEIATLVGIPKIVGYLAAGVVFGPSALGTVTTGAAEQLTQVSQLAVALIAFLAGAELRWSEVRERGVLLLKMMSAELTLSFGAVFALLYLGRGWIPFFRDIPDLHALVFSLLFAAVAIVHSPAVTMALISETEARGPVARTTLGVVLLSDVAVVLLFSGVMAAARILVPPSGSAAGPSIGALVWEILGALLVGTVIGLAVALYLRFVHRELMLFAILVAFFGVEITTVTHVEMLLTLLAAGFVAENISRAGEGEALRHAMERSAAPVFVVFFALSGAKIDLGGVAELILFVVPIALVRMGAIWAGTRVGARWAGARGPERRYVWMGLVSQAGVAIGLSSIIAGAYPGVGDALRGLLLALIAVNETVGPILFRRALDVGGETQGSTEVISPSRGPAPVGV